MLGWQLAAGPARLMGILILRLAPAAAGFEHSFDDLHTHMLLLQIGPSHPISKCLLKRDCQIDRPGGINVRATLL